MFIDKMKVCTLQILNGLLRKYVSLDWSLDWNMCVSKSDTFKTTCALFNARLLMISKMLPMYFLEHSTKCSNMRSIWTMFPHFENKRHFTNRFEHKLLCFFMCLCSNVDWQPSRHCIESNGHTWQSNVFFGNHTWHLPHWTATQWLSKCSLYVLIKTTLLHWGHFIWQWSQSSFRCPSKYLSFPVQTHPFLCLTQNMFVSETNSFALVSGKRFFTNMVHHGHFCNCFDEHFLQNLFPQQPCWYGSFNRSMHTGHINLIGSSSVHFNSKSPRIFMSLLKFIKDSILDCLHVLFRFVSFDQWFETNNFYGIITMPMSKCQLVCGLSDSLMNKNDVQLQAVKLYSRKCFKRACSDKKKRNIFLSSNISVVAKHGPQKNSWSVLETVKFANSRKWIFRHVSIANRHWSFLLGWTNQNSCRISTETSFHYWNCYKWTPWDSLTCAWKTNCWKNKTFGISCLELRQWRGRVIFWNVCIISRWNWKEKENQTNPNAPSTNSYLLCCFKISRRKSKTASRINKRWSWRIWK